MKSKKFSWEFIEQFHLNPPEKNTFIRSKKVFEDYKKYLLTDGSKKILDYYFNKLEKIDRGWVLSYNKFSYNVEDNVDHLLFWIYPGRNFSIPEIDEILKSKIIDYPFIYFQNNPDTRSITNIPHYHVFIKRF